MSDLTSASLAAHLPTSCAIVVATVCLITDIARRRILNAVTLPAVAIGLILGFVLGGWTGLLQSAGGLAVGFALMILPYYVGGMGAGDVKLTSALGALMGLTAIVQIFLYTAIIGGVIAIITALSRGTLKRAFGNIANWTTSLVLQRLGGVRGGLKETQLAQTAGMIPYGVAIALGLYGYLILGRII